MNVPVQILERSAEMTDAEILAVCADEGLTDAEAAFVLEEARGGTGPIDGLPSIPD